MDLTAEGAEAAYFYEAVTRPREWLLLTRPRIADNGAPWQASPYWEEVRQRVTVEPIELTGGQPAGAGRGGFVAGVAASGGSAQQARRIGAWGCPGRRKRAAVGLGDGAG